MLISCTTQDFAATQQNQNTEENHCHIARQFTMSFSNNNFPPIPPLPPPPLQASTSKGRGESLTEILLSTTSAAATRNEEATLLFQNIACILDDALHLDHLPHHLHNVLRDFITDLNTVARRHFERHVNALPRPPPPYSNKMETTTEFTTRSNAAEKKTIFATPAPNLPAKPSRTFAAVATTPKLNQTQRQIQQQNHPQTSNPSRSFSGNDNRLLVRVSAEHPALSMSPYAVMQQLNNFLESKIVREIQKIKTGFAICPISAEAQEILYTRMEAIESFISTQGECKVEKPQDYQAYRLSGVPRTYTGFNGSTLAPVEITASTIATALEELTNVAPIKILETKGSSENQYMDQKNWIVLYPRGSQLSRSLPLFGVRIPAKLLPKRTRIPQCGRCFGWHNERSCVRASRCRLCGSTQHIEKDHTSCDPTRPHACPPKCVNCHGPHPADSLECLIRPNKDNVLPDKRQITQIRHAAAAARLRLKITHCRMLGSNEASSHANEMETILAPSSTSTVDDLFSENLTSTHGRYVALSQPNRKCSQTTMHDA